MNKLDLYNQRFGGIARLYGAKGLSQLFNSSILVVGLGGVGSWAAESLARSGIGSITLVDLDDICITNTNRQSHAMSENYGKQKSLVLMERILSINPDCQVRVIDDFFTEKTSDAILDSRFDYVIDAIDSLHNKCLLLSRCREKNIPLVVTGGAAGKTNPSLIQMGDLGESFNDSLLFRMRKKLRQDFDFPSASKSTPTKRQKFNAMCIFSPEEPLFPTKAGDVCHIPDEGSNLKMDCETGMGSVSHITALFGFMAAGHIVNSLARKDSNKP
ncbi:MAG: tRNA threonylcarbamoyladenosine dehydratase [Bacteriovoracaceae bacterium]|nr:tRNA threonylcarbamoyladenosine dehydratase [Bacteriovoracaceae bacterium]